MSYGVDPEELTRRYEEAMSPRRAAGRAVMVIALVAFFALVVVAMASGGG